MPTYEYLCKGCDTTYEKIFRMDDFPDEIKCNICNGRAHKIISLSAIKTDNDVPWLASASKVLVKEHERPLETRTEYNRYLKDNGLQPAG